MVSHVPTVQPDSLPSKPLAESAVPGRLLYLDNLRATLIAGIIVAHAATHYIGGGAWISHQELAGKILIVVMGAVGLLGGLFWIGLFFFIAGFLTHRSLEHHGARRFLHERAVRLGIPFLIYLVTVMPLLRYWLYCVGLPDGATRESFLAFVGARWLEIGPGPLWFVADLLIFSAGYALWWRVGPDHSSHAPGFLPARTLPALATAIAISTFVVHLYLPLNTYQFWDLHFSQWPQYIVLFWFGAHWARRGWPLAVFRKTWIGCGIVTLVSAISLAAVALAGGVLAGNAPLFTGGWHWQALLVACVEGALAVCGSLWVLEFFRRFGNRQNMAVRQMCRSAYGAFVFHAPLIEAFALLLVPLRLPFEASFLLLAPTTVIASFGLAWLVIVRFRWLPNTL